MTSVTFLDRFSSKLVKIFLSVPLQKFVGQNNPIEIFTPDLEEFYFLNCGFGAPRRLLKVIPFFLLRYDRAKLYENLKPIRDSLAGSLFIKTSFV